MFEHLSDQQLLAGVAADEAVASAAVARQAARIAVLESRRSADEIEFVADEVRMELHLTARAAEGRVSFAESLVGRPAVFAALLAGCIDVPRARVLLDDLATCSAEVREAVEEQALGYAPAHTTTQVRAFIQRRVHKLEPQAAARRRAQAREGRRVAYTPLPDGMAELYAVLPAEQARAVYEQLCVLARSSGCRAGRDGSDGSDGDRSADARRADALVALCLGQFEQLGVPVPGWLAQGAHEGGARFPTAFRRVELQVLVPATTLLGVGDEPARLLGHGPIPHDLLTELAYGSDTVWRRILTDPVKGQVLHVDAGTYRPPAALSRFVAVRDGQCTAPGCQQPAAWADLDHVVPYPHGPTSEANLQALCRRHHRMKHTGRWQVRRDPEGTTTWVTPAGRRFTDRPEGAGVMAAQLAEVRPLAVRPA